MNLVYRFLLFAMIFCPSLFAKPDPVTLKVSVLYSTKGHKTFYEHIVYDFEREVRDIDIELVGYQDAQYKNNIEKWLTSDGEMDVLYWQAGERLKHFARKGYIHPLTDFWNKEGWDNKFDEKVKSLIKMDEHVYALPYSFYNWGFFYNRELFQDLGITVPKNWEQFLSMCRKSKSNRVIPISIGSKDTWVVPVWFDYFNLRLNGLEFHTRVLNSEVSFYHPKIKQVFKYWKKLVDDNCFNSQSDQFGWSEPIPQILRKHASVTLLGNFISKQVPEQYHKSLGFFPFPQLNSEVGNYEDIPVDVFLISNNSKKKDAAKRFLQYLADPAVQYKINKAVGRNSPHKGVKVDDSYFSKIRHQVMEQSTGLSVYYDRAVDQNIVTQNLEAMGQFLLDGNISKVQAALEKSRLTVINK